MGKTNLFYSIICPQSGDLILENVTEFVDSNKFEVNLIGRRNGALVGICNLKLEL